MYLGIDVGSTNVKLCLLRPGQAGEDAEWRSLAHEGNVGEALLRGLAELGLGAAAGTAAEQQAAEQEAAASTAGEPILALATGTEGRRRIALPAVIGPVAVEEGLKRLGLQPRAVVSLGGEDLVVYTLDEQGRIVSTYAGNKCASGTGEFFRQQLGRMNLTLDDLERVAATAKVHRISARCSVFMKSDCTHRLNKGESTPGDIALSLSKVMADKVGEFLTKARIRQGQVALVGGVTRNRFLVEFLRQAWPEIDFVVPELAPCFEAFGAAHLAAARGKPLPEAGALLAGGASLSYGTYPPLTELAEQVRYMPSRRGTYDPDAEYILGVDGGSTTTKVALIDAAKLTIVAEHYGRTHGDPVAALKDCIRQVKRQLGEEARPRITLVATTGSSRELLGVFLETAGVYNEIIAHTVGTTYFEPRVSTIFEIGGQDAKYVLINNSVPIDYAMNEACSAGTGSFLEESSRGDLSIARAEEIGPVALEAGAPLKFGQHCSAFINSDIRKAIQQGAPREDIVAGLVFSVVANYLNRVVGNRTIGEHIVLQGGVAKNPAVPLAFARMTGKPITVPPDPELMGCFGVALLARTKHGEGLLAKGEFDLDAILARQLVDKGSFTCKSCENLCEIRNLDVGGHRYPFGGRCSKYTNARKKRRVGEGLEDYIARRTHMLFSDFAPNPAALVTRSDKVVGAPLAFSMHSLWPLYSWFFHELGVKLVLSGSVAREGLARLESNYCFPVEIAHGAIQDLLDRQVDYLFLPHFRDMPSHEQGKVHACVCPLTQGLPFFSRQAFGLGDERVLRPVVSFKHGWEVSRPAFERVAEQLGFTRAEGAAAFDRGITEYRRFLEAYRRLGAEVLRRVEADPDTIYVALLGRPYNAFTRDANMGIPRKFASHGITVIPFDLIYSPEDPIYPNMYWYYGQQNMKAVQKVKKVPNLYLTWISNFSCAPDSFMLHYVRWMMGQKPYLVLEIDSHTADAGIDTRVEAFLDIVESYRRAALPPHEPVPVRRYDLQLKREFADLIDRRTGERFDMRDPRVTLVWPSMGDLGVQAMAAVSRKQGLRAAHLPLPTVQSTQLAREVASGKECIPALLVLGQVLQFFRQHPPNQPGEVWLVFVPTTLGPCRTGQYHVFYERLFEQLGWENVVLLVAGSENSYRELGPTFSKDAWWGMVLGDVFTDVRLGLRLLARDVPAALQLFDRCWQEVVAGLSTSLPALERALARAGRELAAVPRRRTLEELRKVLIVGEIYVRRDNFSVQELSDYLIEQGIFPKVTDTTEWLHYTDFSRKLLMDEQQRREGLWRSLRSGLLKEQAVYQVEKLYKDLVEGWVNRHIKPTGLIPGAPHDMEKIVATAQRHFIDPDLETEATVSSGVAATAMNDGYHGVAIIAPFGCLPGRLIEGVYAPWARRRGYPVIALENDGQPYPPSTLARMEVFAHNVLRFEKGEQVAQGRQDAR